MYDNTSTQTKVCNVPPTPCKHVAGTGGPTSTSGGLATHASARYRALAWGKQRQFQAQSH